MNNTRGILFAAVLVTVSLARGSSAQAQAPSPAETAYAAEVAPPPSPTPVRLELERGDVSRLDKARRLRRTGYVLMGLSLATIGTMALVGIADHSCDHSTDFACIDGPGVYAAMGAFLTAPVLLTGAGLTTAGYVIQRRERHRRASLAVSATGMRLSF